MNIERLVQDSFTSREQLAPDADEVMTRVRAELDHRPSRTAWPLTAAAAAVVVAVVAGTTWGVSELRNHPGTPSAAAPVVTAHPTVPAPTKSAVPPAKPAIAALTMPFDLGWLPAGTVNYVARRIGIGSVGISGPPSFDGEYLMTITSSNGFLDVDVQQLPGDLSGVHFKSGPGVAVTIGGQPGIESKNSDRAAGYEVYVRSGSGLIYVNVLRHTAPAPEAADLKAIGRKVAANVQLPGTATVHPAFGIGFLPAGVTRTAFDVEGPGEFGSGSTTYQVGTTKTVDSASAIVLSTSSMVVPTGDSGRAVQGHQTRTVTDGGYNTLYVLRAVGAQAVSIAARLPLAELYQIADGLVLPK